MRILVVCEHGGKGSPVGMLAKDLVDALAADTKNQVSFLHVNRVYQPGGLKLTRLLNYVQIHLLLPIYMLALRLQALFSRQKLVVIATTNPPLIYWNAVVTGLVLFTPVIIWFQDANLDFIARRFPKLGNSLLMRLVNAVDAQVFEWSAGVVTLDDAMRDALVRRLSLRTEVRVSPPWATYLLPPVPMRTRPHYHTLRLLYAGNYGKSHDLTPLANFLKEDADAKCEPTLHFIGISEQAKTELMQLFAGIRGEIKFFPRLPDVNQLKDKMHDYDFGVVSLAADYAGISAPSKAYTYLSQGLPILYVGPSGTGADQIVRSGNGITLRELRELRSGASAPEQVAKNAAKIFPNPRSTAIQAFTNLLGQI